MKFLSGLANVSSLGIMSRGAKETYYNILTLTFILINGALEIGMVQAENVSVKEEEISAVNKDVVYVLTEIELNANPTYKRSKWDTGVYMAPCTSEEDCDAAFRMICKSGHCVCKPGDLFFEWPKYGCFSKVHMFGPCEVSGQCIALNANTYCNPDSLRCTCSPNYFFNGRECALRYDNNLKAQEVYKAAVVAAACFIVAVVGIFVACIVRRSFCRREPNLHQGESNRNGDIFSISDEIAALRAVDKPPSYEEVLQIERTFFGIPPPEYSASRNGNSAQFHLPSTYTPEQVNYLNPPYEANAPPLCYESEDSSGINSDCRKESDEVASEIYASTTNSSTSHFLAAAEVISPPSNVEETSENRPSNSESSMGNLRKDIHNHFISSTPPPCLRRDHIIRPSYISTSLPGTPLLSTHKACPTKTSTISNNELLNGDYQTDVQSVSTTSAEVASCSLVHDSDINTNTAVNTSDSNETHSLGYDNLGFVSDFHV